MSRQKIAGTLEYLRMEDVCRITLVGKRAVTNNEGYAFFCDFQVLSGP
jgi:hypothetical protein